MKAEEWRPVIGYEGAYEISSFGRIRSLDRVVTIHPNRWGGTTEKKIKGDQMTPQIRADGYPTLMLSLDGVKANKYLHHLVCEAFHGARPPGYEVAHNDGQPPNCRADNLRWSTPAENSQDRIRHGTQIAGHAHPNTRLAEELANRIRSSLDTEAMLGAQYGISAAHAGNIRRGTRRKPR